MWPMLILVVLASLTGFYTMRSEEKLAPLAAMKNEDLAGNMAVYRSTVLAYLAAHPEVTESISISDEALATVRPHWYTPSPLWRNRFDATTGLITIYAVSPPPTKITLQIVQLSQGSELAGEANAALAPGTLYSPLFANPTHPRIPLPAGVTIPDGSPVWMAKRT